MVVGASVQQGGGINNQGTLVLDGMDVRTSIAIDGGGIYNAGTLYLCGTTTFSASQAPLGTENDISGTPAQKCPLASPGT
jgi:hypothetical protein